MLRSNFPTTAWPCGRSKARSTEICPPHAMWGFGSTSPGPTFETRSNHGLIVEWVNELPQRHFLPIDHTLHGAEANLPSVRSVIHLHGGKTPPDSDGYPEQWCVPGKSATFYYPNRQDAAMLFYHDHTMGINRLNIYAGLQGMYFIRDQAEDALKLPQGKYEVPLAGLRSLSSSRRTARISRLSQSRKRPGFLKSSAMPSWSTVSCSLTWMLNRASIASG